jgi:hypothetical protein
MAGITEQGGRRERRWRMAAWAMPAGLMLLPLLAMQFTDEVNWNAADFVALGALLAGVGIAF